MYQEIFRMQARLLEALAQPKRIEIVSLLRNNRLSVGQIQRMLDLPQANLSQHLKNLKMAGVVRSEKRGKQVFYTLADKKLIKVIDLVRETLIERYKNKKEIVGELALSINELVPIVADPVCKMRVSPKTAGGAWKYRDQTYFFCAEGCETKFRNDPKKYI